MAVGRYVLRPRQGEALRVKKSLCRLHCQLLRQYGQTSPEIGAYDRSRTRKGRHPAWSRYLSSEVLETAGYCDVQLWRCGDADDPVPTGLVRHRYCNASADLSV